MEEDRHVWKQYLSRAVSAGDDALFESALSYHKTQVRSSLPLLEFPAFDFVLISVQFF